jgi:UDP-GlcNAc:undecaprenyl-phosphate/decaprenyl-phosphate GlcNAc-1-phosphate transferase
MTTFPPALAIALAAAVGATATLLLTPAVIRVAAKFELYDVPTDGRRVHTTPIPRLGGVAVFAAMSLGLLALPLLSAGGAPMTGEMRRIFVGILLGGLVLFGAGLVDDLRGLRPSHKLLAQVAAALVAFAAGIEIARVGFGSAAPYELGWLALPVTVLWIVGVTNAFNLIDGLDGLASGIALVALVTIGIASSLLGNLEVVVVCAALIGALLGFLRFNFNPARIFLGDSGSLFVGFMLAVLSVHGSTKSATAMLAIVPLFALAIPLLDTGLAILRRWLRGVAFSSPDARHVHHRLLALGLTQRRTATVMYVAASVLAGIGLMIAFAPPTTVVLVATLGSLASLLLMLYGVHKLDYHELLAAGLVLAGGPRRARRVIQDKIHAWDLCRLIEVARTRDELDAVLEDSAASFGFLHIELCREEDAGRWRTFACEKGRPRRVWKVYFPVSAPQAEGAEYYLRISCDRALISRPYGADRVAGILAPALEQWLLTRGTDAEAVASRPMPEDLAPHPGPDANRRRATHAIAARRGASV